MKTTRVRLLGMAVCVTFLAAGPVQAVTETFDSYPTHTNSTPTVDPGGDTYFIYGDWDTNSQVIGSWEVGVGGTWEAEAAVNGVLPSAGIGSNGQDTYAFGTGSGSDRAFDLISAGPELGIMDFGMHDWGLTSGVIADYLGPNGRDLHGGWMDVRAALLSGLAGWTYLGFGDENDLSFAGQIRLGFVSNSLFDYGEGDEWVEFLVPTVSASASFAWYHGDLNDFVSDTDGTPYGDLPDVKVLGVWVEAFSGANTIAGELENGPSVTTAGQLQVDEVVLVPEPVTLALLLMGGLALKRRRR